MNDELEAQIRDLHSRGEISDIAFAELLGNDTKSDVDEEAEKIIKESIKMGDRGAPSPPEGQTCERDGCNEDAVRGPGDEWLCREHQDELFSAWHG